MPPLFTPGVTRIHSQPMLVAAGKQQVPDRAGVWTFMPKYKLPARLPSASRFLPGNSTTSAMDCSPGMHALPCLCIPATLLLFG